MDGLRHVPELIGEFVTRRDYIAVYLGAVGIWCLWLALRGLSLGSTTGFGWRGGSVTGGAALSAGRTWFAIAVALLASGAVLWFTV